MKKWFQRWLGIESAHRRIDRLECVTVLSTTERYSEFGKYYESVDVSLHDVVQALASDWVFDNSQPPQPKPFLRKRTPEDRKVFVP